MNKRAPKTVAFLFTICQKENESLRDYMQRFVEAVHEVPHVNHELLASIVQQNLLPGRFKESIAGKSPNTMEDLLMRSPKYIRIEESNASDPSHSIKRKGQEEEKERKRRNQPQTPIPAQPPNGDNLPTARVIAVISGGPAGGDSANARKILVRAAKGNQWQTPTQVLNVNLEQQEKISFSRQDLDPLRNQNNDAFFISATLSNFWVKKVLVDSGSSADIIFYDTYAQLGIDNVQLRKVNTQLTGFSSEMIEPLGEVMLPLSLSFYLKRSTKMVKFLVVKAPSTYNIILGRPSLNILRAIASTYHMKLKFPTLDGVGEATGDERMAQECYANTLKRSREKLGEDPTNEKGKRKLTEVNHGARGPPPPEDALESSGTKRVEAIEELKVINLSQESKEKTTRIGTVMSPAIERHLTQFLKENNEVFTWSMTDLHGISPNIITHRLSVNPDTKPVKQKKRMFGVERSQAIKEEVDKVLKAKYIRPVQYPKWLANVVCVPRLQPNSAGTRGPRKSEFHHGSRRFLLQRHAVRVEKCGSGIPTTCQPYVLKSDWMKHRDNGLPFFKVLRGVGKFEWNKTSQDAFDDLKRYLVLPPLLTKHKTRETLYLYLAVSESAVSAVLVRQECKEHHPVYYVSKVLQGAETRYSQIEKLALSLVIAARKLRPYFQSHQVVVLTNHPLKQVLANPELSGRMVKWAVELSEFGVEFCPRPVQGSYEARDEKMGKYFMKEKSMLEKFQEVSVIQVLRANNAVADQLAKLASSMAAIQNRKITFLSSQRAAVEEQEEIMCADPTHISWKEDVVRFITTGIKPENENEKTKREKGIPLRHDRWETIQVWFLSAIPEMLNSQRGELCFVGNT
ncbi:UNVERIFIED_CONTAM: hypothetical protein Slati_3790600 [Sesamum latifolium]|uniref:Reverse transcriptase/retrotransposon-derived protein RNase H-like domain-containing protein n=1 Tax=Sesamum latifolium TaxID=2727402 RepID=A0AAW2U5A6_9LAMI